MSRRVAVVLAGCAVCAAPLWADEAEQAFQLLYAKDLQRVRATADKADDAALARQMVDAARSAAGQPGLITILCEQAYALASTHASAYETAIDAMNLLAETVPSKKKECLDRNLDVYQRRYAGAHGEARVEAGKELIGYLRGLADQAVASEDYAAAMGYLRRASYVAVAIRSGAKDDIQARLKQLISLDRTAKLIASLKDHLQADPKDTAVRERLIRLYVTEWDDPNSAARFLDAGCEHTLQTYVPMAARDVDSLADAACLELGDWYLSLADRASEAGKVVTLRRAQRYYASFLAKHKAADLAVARLRIALKKIEDQLAKISPSQVAVSVHQGSSARPKTGGGLSMLALVTRPGRVEGVRAWTIETRQPRGNLHAVAFAPDGRHVAVGGEWGTVRILSADTGKLMRILVGHEGEVRDLAFSPDSATLVSAGADKTIRLWRVDAGRLLVSMRGHTGAVSAVAFSPDGRTLASGGGDGNLGLWRTQSGRLGALLATGGSIRGVAWVLNGKAVATMSGRLSRHGREVALWSAATGQSLPLPPPPRTRDKHSRMLSGDVVAISPDSKTLAIPGRAGEILLRDFRAGKDLRTLKAVDAQVTDLVFSPDGGMLAANEQDRRTERPGTIRLWDTKSWESVMELKAGGGASFTDLAWSGDGKMVAAIASDNTTGVWEAASGRAHYTVPAHKGASLKGMVLSADGKTIACGTSASVWFWDLAAGGVRALAGGYQNRSGVHALAFSPDGKFLATGAHDGVRVVDANSGQVVATISSSSDARGPQPVSAVSWSADSGILAYATDSTAHIATVGTWKHVLSMRSEADAKDRLRRYDAITDMALAPDGKLLACAVRGYRTPHGVDLWQVPGGQRLHNLGHEKAEALALAWGPDGKTLATGTDDGKVVFWDARTGHFRKVITGSGGEQVHALAWSPNGRTIAVAGCGAVMARADWGRPSAVRVWSLENGRVTGVLRGHVSGVHSLAWSRDGATLVSAGSRMIKLWDLKDELARVTILPLGGTTIAVGSEGHFLASGAAEPAKDFVYVAETIRGQETFSPADFAGRYGWKNDPGKLGQAKPTTKPAGE